MDGVIGLAAAIETGMKKRFAGRETKAERGVIHGGKVRIGDRSYPFETVVDCSTGEGSLVWVLLSKNGTAVIVGA